MINPDSFYFDPSTGWTAWYDLDSGDPLNVSDRFGTSEFATRYDGRWRYKIMDVTNYDYRKAEVEVKWDETQL